MQGEAKKAPKSHFSIKVDTRCRALWRPKDKTSHTPPGRKAERADVSSSPNDGRIALREMMRRLFCRQKSRILFFFFSRLLWLPSQLCQHQCGEHRSELWIASFDLRHENVKCRPGVAQHEKNPASARKALLTSDSAAMLAMCAQLQHKQSRDHCLPRTPEHAGAHRNSYPEWTGLDATLWPWSTVSGVQL